MTRKEWQNLQTGDIIQETKSGTLRKILHVKKELKPRRPNTTARTGPRVWIKLRILHLSWTRKNYTIYNNRDDVDNRWTLYAKKDVWQTQQTKKRPAPPPKSSTTTSRGKTPINSSPKPLGLPGRKRKGASSVRCTTSSGGLMEMPMLLA